MKKLSKIKAVLKAKLLSEQQLKHIKGGGGDPPPFEEDKK